MEYRRVLNIIWKLFNYISKTLSRKLLGLMYKIGKKVFKFVHKELYMFKASARWVLRLQIPVQRQN